MSKNRTRQSHDLIFSKTIDKKIRFPFFSLIPGNNLACFLNGNGNAAYFSLFATCF